MLGTIEVKPLKKAAGMRVSSFTYVCKHGLVEMMMTMMIRRLILGWTPI